MNSLAVPTAAVSLQGVTKEFGKGESSTLVLRGVNLDVYYGEITLIVGQSGSGKTTLLSVAAGLLNATSGTVMVLGQDLAALSPKEQVLFRRKNLGFAFQQFNLLPALSACENAAVPLLAAGVNRHEAIHRASLLLDRLGMTHRYNALPSKLSGGEQQRVAFARALIHEPHLVIADEPTSSLDSQTGQLVMELLTSISFSPNRAVIIVTHDDRIFRFGNRIATMSDGIIDHITSHTITPSS
jgi:putative ABC transport system ATP-binding protein